MEGDYNESVLAQQKYAEAAKYQMMQGRAAGSPLNGGPKTFDQIEGAVLELSELNKRLSCALDRLGHCPKEACDAAADGAGPARIGPDYSRSLNKLRREISELRSNVSALETHI